MIPKQPLFGVKVFINGKEVGEIDFDKFIEFDASASTTDRISERGSCEQIYNTIKISFRLKKINRRFLIRLLQDGGALKRPKLTYKTNRFWKIKPNKPKHKNL